MATTDDTPETAEDTTEAKLRHLEELGSAALRDPGAAMHDEVLEQPWRLDLGSLDRERHARIAAHVPDLLLRPRQVGRDDLVAVEADPHARDLR